MEMVLVDSGPWAARAPQHVTPRHRRKGLRRIARALTRLHSSGDQPLHSPRLQALETANALMRRVDGESAVSGELLESPSTALLERIHGHRILIVGHEPWLGQLACWLVLGRPEKGRFDLAQGGVAWLVGELRPGGMRLNALLHSRALRALVRGRRKGAL